MAVVIEDMDVPKSCASCPLVYEIEDEVFCPFSPEPLNFWIETHQRSEYCKLKEVI